MIPPRSPVVCYHCHRPTENGIAGHAPDCPVPDLIKRFVSESPELLRGHYISLAERLERLAYELRGRSEANVIDLLEAAQYLRDHEEHPR